MNSDVIGIVLAVVIVVALLSFMAVVLLTCISLAKTRLVTVFGYVAIGLLALVAVLAALASLGLPRTMPY